MPDGGPFRQKYFRRRDDNESTAEGQPFLIVLGTMSVALMRSFVLKKRLAFMCNLIFTSKPCFPTILWMLGGFPTKI